MGERDSDRVKDNLDRSGLCWGGEAKGSHNDGVRGVLWPLLVRS